MHFMDTVKRLSREGGSEGRMSEVSRPADRRHDKECAQPGSWGRDSVMTRFHQRPVMIRFHQCQFYELCGGRGVFALFTRSYLVFRPFLVAITPTHLSRPSPYLCTFATRLSFSLGRAWRECFQSLEKQQRPENTQTGRGRGERTGDGGGERNRKRHSMGVLREGQG